MTNGRWDDDRIDRAIRAAFDREPPSGLSDAVVSDLRSKATLSPSNRWGWLGAAMAAVLIVAVAVGASLSDQPPTATGSPSPSSISSAGEPSPTPTQQTVYGLPVSSVEDALAFRDLDLSDAELAVEGWIKPLNFASLRCMAIASNLRPLFSSCGALFLRSDKVWGSETVELAIRPIGLNLDWVAEALRSDPEATPLPAIVLGHFDDRRAGLCGQPEGSIVPDVSGPPSEEVLKCRDVFVADAFASVDGRPVSNHSTQHLTPASWSLQGAFDAIAAYVRPELIVSSELIRGESIGHEEPALATGHLSLNSAAALWVLRALNDEEPPRVDTYIVPDGVPIVFRSTRLGPEPGPFAHAFEFMSHWEGPAGPPAFVVQLGATEPLPSTVEIWDDSGLVLEARQAEAGDPEIPANAFDIRGQASTFVSDETPNRLRVTWEGGECQNYRVLLKRDATVIQIRYSPILARADCGGPVLRDVTLIIRKPAARAFVEQFVDRFALD